MRKNMKKTYLSERVVWISIAVIFFSVLFTWFSLHENVITVEAAGPSLPELSDDYACCGNGGNGSVTTPKPCVPSWSNGGREFYGSSSNGNKVTDHYDPKEYLACTISPPGGTLYEQDLSASDFTTKQPTKEKRYSKYEQKQSYKIYNYDSNCGSSPKLVSSGIAHNGGYSATFADGYRNLTETGTGDSITSAGTRKSGTVTWTAKATMNGVNCGSASKPVYWVKLVTITPSADTLEDEGEPTAACKTTYGDGKPGACSAVATKKKGGTNVEFVWKYTDPPTGNKDEKRNYQWFFKDITLINGVSDVRVDAINGVTANPEVKCLRNYFNGETRDCTAKMLKDPNKFGWSTGGGTRTAYFMYEYKGPISGIYDKKEEFRSYHYVVSVEFPNSNSKDAYVSTSAIYNDDAPAPPLVEEGYNVECFKTYADGHKTTCINGGMTHAASLTGSAEAGYPGGSHPAKATFEHNTNKNGWSLGGPVRHNYYSFEENAVKSEWTVNMLYVVKVEMANGTPENEFVAVNETHFKKNSLGIPTKATDPQDTDPYTPPTCEKTFAADSNGVQQVRNCFPQMEWNFNFNGWGMGGPERILRFKYKENLKEDEWKIHFTYVSKVDITISKDYLFQDEDYGTYTCIKTYHQTYIGGGNTKDCLDRMFIDSDSGQNMNMGGQRKINYDYINNGHNDLTLQTRVYANKTIFTSTNETEGYSGHREDYTCDVLWQDNARKDVTNEPLVWTSTAFSVNGEKVNFIGEDWIDGYVDVKGDQHKPDSINQFYVPDPISKDYHIHCIYPELPNPPYNNGLKVGWSYAEDKYSPGKSNRPFEVIGIQEIQLVDDTNKIHEVDTTTDGTKLKTAKEVTAKPYTGKGVAPYGMAFNDKTYQTGHWYDFKTKVIWDNGFVEYIEDTSKYPEMTFRYEVDGWQLDGSGYKVGGQNTYFPINANDHRLPLEGWNAIRFDLFSEKNILKPSGQENTMKSKTFETASIWAHSPIELMIDGPLKTDWNVVNDYKGYLLWNDGTSSNQKGDAIGQNNNPWGNGQGTKLNITDSPTTGWQTSEQESLIKKDPVQITFNEFKGNGNYRTVSAWWGDKDRAESTYGLPGGFEYWDYLFQEIEVQVGDKTNNSSTADGCQNAFVPKFGCALPIDNQPNPNYRLPENQSVLDDRTIEHHIDFNVTGVSKGTGQ